MSRIPDGSKRLYLAVDDVDGYAFDWADWCEPRLVMADGSEKKLTDLKWKNAPGRAGGNPRVGKNAGGGALKVAGKPVAYGIGVHANFPRQLRSPSRGEALPRPWRHRQRRL